MFKLSVLFCRFLLDKRCKGSYTIFEKQSLFYIAKGGSLGKSNSRIAKKKKLSQEELAEKLEVTRQTIISLEKGRYNASLLLAHKIASFFNLRIEEVFLFEEDES
ncbi:helix-turn-helix transcriptional regulator [Streptococcus sanguinis]|uniref:Helix-turn-helix transcriptional regulator n=1 Tax=Streptococcus sanguinis TaxID=1305 RepID=A0A7Y0YRY9_STRSA|nr:helix-turn-helix transcriptional regulator [Streptococcus sanguinis]